MRFRPFILSPLLALLLTSACIAQQVTSTTPESVLTQHNDIARSGADYNETVLNTSNVNPATFGKLFTRAVDGQIYAQPLYVPNVAIPHAGVHNVIYLATDKNTVYAYDADDPTASTPYWQVNLGPPCPYTDFYTEPETDFNEVVGITGTPVIDPGKGVLYVVAKTKENGKYFQRLHVLSIYTGQEEPNSPVLIAASVPGKGYDAVNGQVVFNPFRELQRPALLLDHGIITICFASHGDHDPYHGWVLQYRADDLKQARAFCDTPDGGQGGIWMAGQGAAADPDGNVYVSAGNGIETARNGGRDYGESLLRLDFKKDDNGVRDWFTPFDVDTLNAGDMDLGSCGLCLVPGTSLILTGSKTSKLYLVDRNRMGHFHSGDDSQIVQTFVAGKGHIHGSPIIYIDPILGMFAYEWSENDCLRQFHFEKGKLNPTPVATSTMVVPQGMPGGMLSVTSDQGKSGTGIVWATRPYSGNANWVTQEGLFQAFDADNVGHELWDSKMNESRDDMGNFAKFCPPTIANGRVYLATFSNQLVVYGLLSNTSNLGTLELPPNSTNR